MKVLVLANEELKTKWLAQPVNESVETEWLDQPGNTSGVFDACIDLLFENNAGRISWLKSQAPLVIVNSVIIPLKQLKEDFVRINGWNTFLERKLVEASCHNDILKERAERLFSFYGRYTEWVPDIAGFVTPRVIASIINEAFLALGEEISQENEIDTAMKLGTNYPFGPFEWGQKIGLDKVYSLLEMLGNEETRYKPAPLLKEKILV